MVASATIVFSSPATNKACPKACDCSAKLVQCSSLDIGKFSTEVYNLKIASKTPIALPNNVFKNLGLESLNNIIFENTVISSIEPNAFDGLFGLTSLNFRDCTIPSLENLNTTSITSTLRKLVIRKSTVSGFEKLKLSSLEELEIVNSSLKTIPKDSFSDMPDLSYINLSGNEITTFDPATFIYLPSIIEINLSNNQITSIPDGIFSDNSDLSTIIMSYNPITKVNIKSDSRIEELTLKSCQITEFTGGQHLSFLGTLDLSHNEIESFPNETFSKMQDLEYLDLSNNNLQTLDPAIFTNNSKLLRIRLNNNEFKTLPKFTTVDDHFQTITFSCENCLLEDIPEDTFEHFPGLVTLKLANNNLPEIREKLLQTLTSLIELDLSYNQITNFKPETFIGNPALNKLNLGNNYFQEIDTKWFTKNGGLKLLDVSSGQLTHLWKQPAKELPALRILNISENKKLTSISVKDLDVMKKLNVLDIGGVKFECGSDVKQAFKWLTKYDVAPVASMKKTHESMEVYNLEADENMKWDDIRKSMCADDYEDYYGGEGLNEDKTVDALEDQDENEDDTIIIDAKKTTNELIGNEKEASVGTKSNTIESTSDLLDDEDDDDEDDDDDDDLEQDKKVFEEIFASSSVESVRHSYLWPILVFLSSSLIVLIVCSTIILLCIKRGSSSPSITLSHVQILPWSSGPTIKKHSGSVYRPLSEERLEPQTPKFNRYEQVPIVHSA